MNKFQDIELLSSYLDGQLSPSDSARLELRLKSDPELASALDDLRAARGILRKLPMRKAPRNFVLSRKMVGAKPPLPRTYSFFRFSTALATALLVFTFAINSLSRSASFSAGAPAFGYGGGGAGSSDVAAPQAFAAATQAPAATEAPAAQAPALELSASPTEISPSSADSARGIETAAAESANPKESATNSVPPGQAAAHNEPFVFSSMWQIVLVIVILLSASITFFISQSAKRKWR